MSHDPQADGLSEEQRRELAGVLDALIPASGDGRLPAAGELGLVAQVEEALMRTPDFLPVIHQGLAAATDLAGRLGAGGFASLTAADKQQVLNDLATEHPALVPGLIFHAYGAYYQEPQVVEALGFESRPPFPLGYAMEPDDLTLLERVRQRPKLYRDPSGP